MDMLGKDVVDDTDPRAVLWGLIRGLWRFSAFKAVVELDLAGHMAAEPALEVREIARRCGTDPAATARLLRTAASIGIVRTTGPDTYALTPAGEMLRAGVQGSMRPAAITQYLPEVEVAMSTLAEAVRGGRSPFAAKYGTMYGYIDGDPEARRQFDTFMSTRSSSVGEAVAGRYDFTGVGTIADIGGGNGTVLAAILKAHPRLRGILFELEITVGGARAHLAAQGVADRCEVVAGDFFAAVPEADAYLLANIVHNWDDDDALRILRNVRSAMPDGGRVLLLDCLLPDDDLPHLGKELDMRMLALFDGGRERGEGEYLALLAKAGLDSGRVFDLPYALSLIEAGRSPR